MKAYKIEVLIIDRGDIGKVGISEVLENGPYPNDCIAPQVKKIEEREIGEWNEDHPLNLRKTAADEYKRLFAVLTSADF
jgi:hypothetical protein